VVIGAINDLMWERLCEALPLVDLRGDPRAATNEARVANRELVDGAIAAAVAPQPITDVTARLKELGVLVAPVRPAATAITDPQVAELGLLDELDGVRLTRTPLSQFNVAALPAAQRLGADTTAVLGERLDLDAGELRQLAAAGVIETAPVQATTGA